MADIRRLARDARLVRKEGPRRYKQFWSDLHEAFRNRDYHYSEFPGIQSLFTTFVPNGREMLEYFDPQYGGQVMLTEAGDTVTTSDFGNITGQLMFSAVLEAFDDDAFIGDQLMPTVSTRLSGEKIPGIGRIGNEAETIYEGDEYPLVGVTEEFIETPETTKEGFIVPVTKEALFFDRTNILMQRAQEVGHWLGYKREVAMLDVVVGATNTYRRNGRAAVANYGNDSGDHDWDNLSASNGLSDWTNIETAELLFADITDPNTGAVINIVPNTILVGYVNRHTARRIATATGIQFGSPGSTSDVTLTNSPQPTGGQYQIITSILASSRITTAGTNTDWFIGEPRRAFAYMENWPIQVVQAPTNSEAEFTRDIVMRFKASHRGTPTAIEPRRMVKCTA